MKRVWIFVLFLLLVLQGSLLLDPDFGWHFRMGELISKNGIPSTDPFSYTMPSFPFVDHEWLISVLFYRLYPVIGRLGLSFILASLVFPSLLIAGKLGNRQVEDRLNKVIYRGKKNIYFIMLLSFAVLWKYFGVRPQVVSWIFFSVLLAVLMHKKRWQKWKLSVPLFTFFWTNLHGSFALVVITLIIVFGARAVRRRRFLWDEAVILIWTILATFLTPYGLKVWREVVTVITDSQLRWNIQEWRPLIVDYHPPALIFLSLSTVLVLLNRKRFKLEELALYLFFLVQAVLSVRHVPLWVIVAYPMTVRSIIYFYRRVKTIKFAQDRLRTVYKTLSWLIVATFFGQLVYSIIMSTRISENNFYPKNAVEFLRSNLPAGEIFSNYGWGGYLIWKLPEKKVFVDGRMPSWREWDSEAGERRGAFDYFRDITAGRADSNFYFDKYGVDTVLWPRNNGNQTNQNLLNKLLKFLKNENNKFVLTNDLHNKSWQKIYEDKVSVIYQKH